MEPSPKTKLSAFIYFTLTALGISWIAWTPVILSRQNVLVFPNVLFYGIGWFGPSLAGIFWTWRISRREGLRDLFDRALRFRFSAGYYAILLFVWPLVFTGAALLSYASGIPTASFAAILARLANPLAFAGLIVVTLIVGPISEEFGWRGFALDLLTPHMGPIFSSVLIGLVWGVWYLPIFYMVGTPQSQVNILPFVIATIALSITFTWMYQSTGRSLAAVILLHFMYNLSMALVPQNDRAIFFLILLQIPIAVPLVIGWLPEHKPSKPHS